ncbi:MAG TPA: permease-like cell division protein FtsX [Gemmatimonadota bacterium]|jgi:cell division transport system permease protein|nr:permease-like cell division protein FtsX [Gemmatimonadota bacterium]
MRYTAREAFFAFRRSPLLTGLSIVTIAFALYTLGVFGLVWLNIERVLEGAEERVEVVAYLRDDTTAEESGALMREVAAYPEVDSIRYVSREDALARVREEFQEYEELYEDLDTNPLPASLEIALEPGFRRSALVQDVAARISRFPFVEEVRFGEEWVRKLNFLQDMSLFLGLVMGGIFAFVAFVAIGATINLVVLAREDEFAIMKMVGATPGFIARPFVLEGFTKGVIGALVALALLVATFSVLERRVLTLEFYSPTEIAIGVALGGVLGSLASILSLRRHISRW